MINLYPAGSIRYTVFEDPSFLTFLKKNKVELTSTLSNADIFLFRSFNFDEIKTFVNFISTKQIGLKPILVWTHEPRYACTDYEHIEVENLCDIYIMNLYTDNVYFSNHTFYTSGIDRVLEPIVTVMFTKKPIVGLATYVFPNAKNFILNDLNIDLTKKRQKLLCEGYKLGLLDIYGRNWPDSIAISESRGKGWQAAKLDLLRRYQFNVAMENTSYNYYCTEKIWDSIKGYCLPIYSSFNNKIYDTFPKNSFIDFDDFKSNKELLDYVKRIDKSEYLSRLNLCIEVFNDTFINEDFKKERHRAFSSLLDKIVEIVSVKKY